MKKFVAIEVAKYFTEKGVHVCATDFQSGDVCQFYRTRKFGQEEVCIADAVWSRLEREKGPDGKEGTGFLIPGPRCPLADQA